MNDGLHESRAQRRRSQARARSARRRQVYAISGAALLLSILTVALLLSGQNGGATEFAVQVEAAEPATQTAAPPVTFQPESTTSDAAPESAPEVEQDPVPSIAGPSTIGYSVNGSPIEAYRAGEGSRRLLVIGGVHGNEWGTEVAEQFLDTLLADPKSVPPNTEIHVIPCMNPDGLTAQTRENARGVDLNRNMPASTWSADLDSRDTAAQRGLLSGDSPGSEPETQAFVEYMQVGFDVVVSLHSKGGIIDWDGEGEHIARRMSAITGLPAQHLGYQPYITGSMGQYVPEKWGAPIITVELDSSTMSDSLFQAILAAIE